MNDLNKVILIGRLAKEPEIKSLPSGNLVCNLVVVTDTSWKKDDKRQVKPEWHKVVTFDQDLIEFCRKYIHVGYTLVIEGQLTYRKITSPDSTVTKQAKLCEIHVARYNGGVIRIFRTPMIKKPQTTDDDNSEMEQNNDNIEDENNVDEEIPFDL